MVSLAAVLGLYSMCTSPPLPVPAVKLPPMLSPHWPKPPCKAGGRSSCLGKPQQPLEHLLESKMLMVREHKYFIEFLPCFHLNLPEFFFSGRQLMPQKSPGASDFLSLMGALGLPGAGERHDDGYLTESLIWSDCFATTGLAERDFKICCGAHFTLTLHEVVRALYCG